METVEKLSADEVKDLESEVSVPYRVEDVTVLSPGEWNGLNWTASELRSAVENTDFDMSQERGEETPPNGSIFFDHKDRSADQWVGRVENVRMEGNDVKSDLVITDKQTAMNLEFGAPFGVSPKADGMVNQQGTMRDFTFENFSLVANPAVKTTWLNEDISTVLQDMEIHRPKFGSADDREWNSPNLEDFTDKSWSDMSSSEKEAVGRHFLISKSGFPAENFGDLALPVVEPDGTLNLNALSNAKSRVGQVSGIDEDEIRRVSKMINNLANGNFEDADFEEVDMAKNGYNEEEDMSGHKDGEMSGHKDEEMSKHKEEMQEVDYKFGSGDKVKWSSSGGTAMGVVRDRTKDGCFNEEIDGDVEVCGEEDAPAYLIEIFDDEEGETTGTMVGHKQDTLENASFELNDITVKNPMAEEEQETQEPEADESPDGEESVENSDDNYVTAEELEDFKSEILEELGDDDEADEEAEDAEGVEEVEEEASDNEELSDFEEFRQENPNMSLSEAAEEFEEQNRDVEDKIEEMSQKFEDKISDLEEKLESKEEEVEELSQKVSNPQRATQASGAEDGEQNPREKVAELSDEELHAAVFKNNLQSQNGVRATKEMMHNE